MAAQLNAPEVNEDGGRDYVLRDSGATLDAVEAVVDVVNDVIGTDSDSFGLVLDPLIGNWNPLTQKGEVLGIVGDAADAAAHNLRSARDTLMLEWQGGAAESFREYISQVPTQGPTRGR